ncbi:hypothetical protein PIB30_068282 [Stylosanthes scabra]|uniref:GAG-pre-integrase domain-containing protein n=1 Tax=Stylosanthes scabra TaxID=79078 RepID=A0ABU6SNT4_9FABA|nr:hypothetical protein [Stylosanthes scabra]
MAAMGVTTTATATIFISVGHHTDEWIPSDATLAPNATALPAIHDPTFKSLLRPVGAKSSGLKELLDPRKIPVRYRIEEDRATEIETLEFTNWELNDQFLVSWFYASIDMSFNSDIEGEFACEIWFKLDEYFAKRMKAKLRDQHQKLKAHIGIINSRIIKIEAQIKDLEADLDDEAISKEEATPLSSFHSPQEGQQAQALLAAAPPGASHNSPLMQTIWLQAQSMKENKEILLRGALRGGLYIFDNIGVLAIEICSDVENVENNRCDYVNVQVVLLTANVEKSISQLDLWHKRLGHPTPEFQLSLAITLPTDIPHLSSDTATLTIHLPFQTGIITQHMSDPNSINIDACPLTADPCFVSSTSVFPSSSVGLTDQLVQVAATQIPAQGKKYSMTTRSISGIYKPRVLIHYSSDLTQVEPTSIAQDLSSSHWKTIMDEEYAALMKCKT